MSLINIRNLGITLSMPLFSNLDLAVNAGDRIGIVAANGRGKSTLLRSIAAMAEATTGEIIRARGLTVGFVEQNVPEKWLSTSFYAFVQSALSSDQAEMESWRVDIVLDALDVGEGLRQPPQDVVVEDVGADERDHDGDDRDDQARAKLVEVLDERDAVLVLQTTREPRHGRVLGVLALRLRLRLSRRLSGRSLRHGRGRRSGGDFLRLRLARGDRVLELPHAASQGASHLRQALGSEEQEQHDEDDDYLRPSQGTHASMVARCLQRGHQG